LQINDNLSENEKIMLYIFFYRWNIISLRTEFEIIKQDIMKKDIHPGNYRPVVFKDMSNDEVFISRSTVNARETIEIDGVTYPLVKLEITSSSHPFYTGKQKLVDTAGRVDKFMNRYGNRNKKK
jgi:large subunit ribosomal protein L31